MLKYIPLFLLLCACSPTHDLQGHEPNAYYAKHPKVNTLETRQLSRVVTFEPGKNVLEPGEKHALYSVLRGASPEAGESAAITVHSSQINNTMRRASLIKTLRSFGYTKIGVQFDPSSTIAANEALVTLTYVAVIPPDCPDWRMSPVTTYSNTHQGNFGCATVVNLGQMVADPHDLAAGSGSMHMDTQRNTQVISDYRAGKSFGASEETGAAASATQAVSGGQ